MQLRIRLDDEKPHLTYKEMVPYPDTKLDPVPAMNPLPV
jgi:hypothetical protein